MKTKHLILVIIAFLAVAISGCTSKTKEPLSLDDFIEIYEIIEGETVEINLDAHTDEAVTIVAGKKNNITINYYQMESNEDADELFLRISDEMDLIKKQSSSKGKNSYYIFNNNGGDYVVKEGRNVIYGKCFKEDKNELLYQFNLLGYYEYNTTYIKHDNLERFGYSLTSKPDNNKSQIGNENRIKEDENIGDNEVHTKEYENLNEKEIYTPEDETMDGNEVNTSEDETVDSNKTNNIEKNILNNIEGNWKNILDDSDYINYVFTDAYYMIKEEIPRPVHYYSYINFYYDEDNLCFETIETYYQSGESYEVNMKYILSPDADGLYNMMNQYISSQNSFDLIATLVRNECNTYEELLNGHLFEYALLENNYGNSDRAWDSSIGKKKLVNGYALLNLDGKGGDELIIRYGTENFYFFTIVNNYVKYIGNLSTFFTDPASENNGDLYYNEKYNSVTTYYDGGNSGPSFYINFKIVGNEIIGVDEPGKELQGKPIKFTEISFDY